MRAVHIEIPLCALAREWADGAVRSGHSLSLRSAEARPSEASVSRCGKVAEVNVLYDRVARHEQTRSINVTGIFVIECCCSAQ
jgi:hypothetical protein